MYLVVLVVSLWLWRGPRMSIVEVEMRRVIATYARDWRFVNSYVRGRFRRCCLSCSLKVIRSWCCCFMKTDDNNGEDE